MTDFVMDDENLEMLEKIAARESRPLNEVLHSALEKYDTETPAKTPEGKLPYPDWLPRTADSPDYDPIEDFFGMIDADVSDLSIKATGSMRDYHVKNNDDSD